MTMKLIFSWHKAILQNINAKLDEAQENVCRLEENYKALKTARMIEVSGDDVRESKARIAHLIREVDKCIALLDV